VTNGEYLAFVEDGGYGRAPHWLSNGTESSYKYDRARLRALTTAAGFRVRRVWTDARRRFWVAFLAVR
jgi:hypothetical protein